MDDAKIAGAPPDSPDHETLEESLVETVDIKERRKLRARRDQGKNVWFGLGMFGVVGWSVSVPMLLFLAMGIWIDRHWPSQYSWTLMFLFVGVALGCFNAWYWVTRERAAIERARREDE